MPTSRQVRMVVGLLGEQCEAVLMAPQGYNRIAELSKEAGNTLNPLMPNLQIPLAELFE